MSAEDESYREWVRRNHPDAGGDTDAFIEGLARWRRAGAFPPGTGAVTVHRTPRSPLGAIAEAVRRRRSRRERARRLL